MVTYQISAMSAILEARLGENFIGPKNQEQVYLELVFATEHDAVIVESMRSEFYFASYEFLSTLN